MHHVWHMRYRRQFFVFQRSFCLPEYHVVPTSSSFQLRRWPTSADVVLSMASFSDVQLSMHPFTLLNSMPWVVAILVGVAILVAQLRTAKPKPAPFPPGPSGLPVLGNIFDFTTKELWIRVAEWAERYG